MSQSGRSCALAKVVATSGSTYRQRGAMMLVADSGHSCGMLSGGCFEGEIKGLAQSAIAQKRTLRQAFDFSDPADLIFGYGLGCDGKIVVECQPLPKEMSRQGRDLHFGSLASLPHLLVLGAGDDVKPLYRFARELGFRITIVDHRFGARGERFPKAEILNLRPYQISNEMFHSRLFVVIMTHNLMLDAEWIAKIHCHPFLYCGILGNRRRLQKLRGLLADPRFREVLSDSSSSSGSGSIMDSIAQSFWERVRCPVGQSLGRGKLATHSPESIAWALATELWLVVKQEQGQDAEQTRSADSTSSGRVRSPRAAQAISSIPS